MNKTKFNLVRNSISHDVGEYFVNEIAKALPPEEIVEMAQHELRAIEYFVRMELPNWNYWKEKKQRLLKLIEDEKHTLRNQK